MFQPLGNKKTLHYGIDHCGIGLPFGVGELQREDDFAVVGAEKTGRLPARPNVVQIHPGQIHAAVGIQFQPPTATGDAIAILRRWIFHHLGRIDDIKAETLIMVRDVAHLIGLAAQQEECRQ